MQAEINRAMPRVPVRIAGIKVIGAEPGVTAMVMGRTIPLVQDSMMALVAMN